MDIIKLYQIYKLKKSSFKLDKRGEFVKYKDNIFSIDKPWKTVRSKNRLIICSRLFKFHKYNKFHVDNDSEFNELINMLCRIPEQKHNYDDLLEYIKSGGKIYDSNDNDITEIYFEKYIQKNNK